ncbi:hypothetical protein [Acrocarpospora sp. B8E8]|uniref:hypothetical protein n=1 Tax=Acrocarpospora sp. B8E8 TaxID=3153572 RepID=UPI00325C3783
MRRTSGMLAGLTVLVPLALTAPPAAAAKITTPTTATTATALPAKAAKRAPYANFKIHHVTYPKKVKAGGKVTYSFQITNVGPHSADYYYIGGILPKGIVTTLKWGGPKGTECFWEGREFWCWPPPILYPNPAEGQTDTTWLTIQITLLKGTRGTLTTKLGAITYDVPTGAENLDKSQLKELGIDGWITTRTVKTKIIAPGSRVYIPPPPKPTPNRTPDRNRKKGT